ncbi:AAA family ATPase [Pseudomonas chlororaphis]|uniref:AAA family ATPase n=1 Tax=Pseudomonas chlororaphis TaxID=587753 RepID=UPI001B30F291|nr:AAA family ATPase [Pseudomonas chlororaphis]QTT80457.1 AAA family ATPase [Pseudomonas chlororaphis]
MKITRVTVKGLFGVFDHDIPLTKESGITIIIGENGLGKTVILESINAFFGGNLIFFKTLKFEKFIFHFDTHECWHLTKNATSSGVALSIAKDNSDKPLPKLKYDKIFHQTADPREARRFARERERRNEYEYRHMLLDSAREDASRYMIERDMIEREMMDRLMFERNQEREKVDPPKWFLEGVASTNVSLIETQRIISPKESGGESYVSTVKNCSGELKEFISKAIKDSSDISSGLDSTYPSRLISKLREKTEYTYDELNKALSALDDKRKNLSSAGLVVDAQDSVLPRIEENQDNLITLLKLYVDDSYDKLKPYDALSQKITLLRSIINKRFKHKKLEISKDEGFVFRSTVIKEGDGYAKILPSKLSSGEQHELVLFYKLIFKSSVNDLILIDEPELSLHISWQNKFIADLKEVAALNAFSAVIATHSPDIISENWDLKIELIGVE